MRYTRLTASHSSPYSGGTVHAYLLHGAVPTLVDAPTGDPAFLDQLAEALEAAGDGPLAQVIVTHAHPDHIDGAVAVHARWPEAVFRKRAPLPEGDGIEWQVIEKEPMIPAGDGPLWVLHTPGHAPDHSCVFDIHDGVLVGGDLAINGSTVTILAEYGGSLRAYLKTLRAVLELQPRVILPAHGEPILQPASLLRGYLSHRLTREQQVLECLAAGIDTADAIVERLYAATADALKPAARQNVLAHLHKLVEDGRVTEAGDHWHLRSA
ncbi:MBL fold hydrolase [Luteitalea sp. TBR-22]|uniref:MBL fold metallo-hydrolase n=1 Tax=Luteitalea sp. TBR-22 TaxID=2802971 RepID=UPI001AF266C5|nr:MBL fold metallo-hydrolase [Luteitalea sp. TBR-22]BCS35766.1 MBL fold hydrolase [Luteitalea sp. TBR-22]